MEQFVYTNEGKVLLKEAVEEEIPKIVELYEGLPKNEYWETEELARIHYELIEEANGTTYVAVLGEEVIGHAEVVLPEDKDELAFLVKLQINDDLRRRKFGTELVRYSMIMIKKKGYRGYSVWPDFDKSKGLYKKLGLKEMKNNESIKFNIKEEIPEVQGQVIEEIENFADLKAFEMVVGCHFAVDFVWKRAFKLAKEEVLDYKKPLIQKVKVDAGEGIIFCDNRQFFVSVPKDEEENKELITALLKYGTQLVKDFNTVELITYIDEDFWQEIEEEMENFWEIEKSHPRLEMEMEFDN